MGEFESKQAKEEIMTEEEGEVIKVEKTSLISDYLELEKSARIELAQLQHCNDHLMQRVTERHPKAVPIVPV